jgi:hypothetical protein
MIWACARAAPPIRQPREVPIIVDNLKMQAELPVYQTLSGDGR